MAGKQTVIVTGAAQGVGAEVSWPAGEGARYRGQTRCRLHCGFERPRCRQKHLGSLDRVTRVVRLRVFIATSGDFFDQPRVADAVSDLFRDLFGIEKTSVRLVIGVASLPLGTPIELEVIFEVAESTAVDGLLEAERV
jgi:hypothetical protein